MFLCIWTYAFLEFNKVFQIDYNFMNRGKKHPDKYNAADPKSKGTRALQRNKL